MFNLPWKIIQCPTIVSAQICHLPVLLFLLFYYQPIVGLVRKNSNLSSTLQTHSLQQTCTFPRAAAPNASPPGAQQAAGILLAFATNLPTRSAGLQWIVGQPFRTRQARLAPPALSPLLLHPDPELSIFCLTWHCP